MTADCARCVHDHGGAACTPIPTHGKGHTMTTDHPHRATLSQARGRLRVHRQAARELRGLLRELDLSAAEKAQVVEALVFLDAALHGIDRTLIGAQMRQRDRGIGDPNHAKPERKAA